MQLISIPAMGMVQYRQRGLQGAIRTGRGGKQGKERHRLAGCKVWEHGNREQCDGKSTVRYSDSVQTAESRALQRQQLLAQCSTARTLPCTMSQLCNQHYCSSAQRYVGWENI